MCCAARQIEAKWRATHVWAADGDPSAALLRAMRPSHAWLKRVLLAAPADHAHATFAALLCGVWWAAALVRVPPCEAGADSGAGDDDGWCDARCAACGARSAASLVGSMHADGQTRPPTVSFGA